MPWSASFKSPRALKKIHITSKYINDLIIIRLLSLYHELFLKNKNLQPMKLPNMTIFLKLKKINIIIAMVSCCYLNPTSIWKRNLKYIKTKFKVLWFGAIHLRHRLFLGWGRVLLSLVICRHPMYSTWEGRGKDIFGKKPSTS